MGSSIISVTIGIIAFIFLSIFVCLISWYKKVPVGKAIIRTGSGGIQIAIENGMFAIPNLHQIEIVDLVIQQIEFDENLKTKNGQRVRAKGHFIIRLNREMLDILMAVQTIGSQRINSKSELQNIFYPKLADGILSVSRNMTAEEIEQNPDKFKVEILNAIGIALSGFVLDDLIFEKLEEV